MFDVNGVYFEPKKVITELDHSAIYESKDGNWRVVKRSVEIGDVLIEEIKGLSKYNRSAIDYDEAMSKGNEFVRLDEVIEIIESMI